MPGFERITEEEYIGLDSVGFETPKGFANYFVDRSDLEVDLNGNLKLGSAYRLISIGDDGYRVTVSPVKNKALLRRVFEHYLDQKLIKKLTLPGITDEEWGLTEPDVLWMCHVDAINSEGSWPSLKFNNFFKRSD